jgi:tetratricopeptide (TPR) repeat protein
MLSAKQRAWVFFMTKDLENRLSTFALDFYSFVRLKAHFVPGELIVPRTRVLFDGFDRLFNYDESKEALERYKELEQEYTSISLNDAPDDLLIAAAISLTNISDLYKNCADYAEALKLLEIVKNIREKQYGNRHALTASAYKKIAEVCELQGDFTKALEWYDATATIYEQELGYDNITTSEIYCAIGLMHDELGDFNEALSWYMKALEICGNDKA